jgi:uncharacterized protein (DUF433 family)
MKKPRSLALSQLSLDALHFALCSSPSSFTIYDSRFTGLPVGYCQSSAAQTKLSVMNSSDLITIDPEILGGTPVFRGTRVPVNTLFEYLENDYSLEEFLDCFPSVSRDLARQVLERSEHALLSPAA